MLDPSLTPSKEDFDRNTALLEAVTEAGHSQEKITFAVNYIENRVTEVGVFHKAYKANFDTFDSNSLVVDMLRDFSESKLLAALQLG
jgi:hypothetical protein